MPRMNKIVGGLLVQWISWHAALLASSLFGAATLAFIALLALPEEYNVEASAVRA